MIDKIKKLAAENFSHIVDIRRHLHKYPELSFEEKETGKYIAGKLDEFGIDFTTGWVENGIVGMINHEKSNIGVIALRADIDALPITEENNVNYRSVNSGVMHACGHDVHASSLLGVAKILKDLQDEIDGCIKLIFQPGEEKLPGGASMMIKEGVLKDPAPRMILGQHVHPPLEVGKVGIKEGMYMASADEVYVTIKGKGGHAALPHECVDTILMTSHVISSVQQIVSRNCNPNIPCVLSFGKINSKGGATNIIPDEVYLEGTFRTMDEKWRAKAHRLIEKNIKGVVEAMGGSCEVNIIKGYPFLYNNVSLTTKVRSWMKEYLGERNVIDLPIRMTGEDFSYYSQQIDACFYRLGTGNSLKGITSPVHTSTFDIDEKALEISIGLMSYLAIKELNTVK